MYNEYITNMASHCLFRLQTYRWISDFNVPIVISIIRRRHHDNEGLQNFCLKSTLMAFEQREIIIVSQLL